ncbi:MAG: RimK-like ATP-grasp domain [Thermoleophilia bacterium]|nr:RimK-like ATP-grasp domain [Thermoleophilia bacterium]
MRGRRDATLGKVKTVLITESRALAPVRQAVGRAWSELTNVPAAALATVGPGTAAEGRGVGRAALVDAGEGVANLRIGIFSRADTGEGGNSALLIGDALARRGVSAIWLDADATRVAGTRVFDAAGGDVGALDFVVTRYPSVHGLRTMDELHGIGVPLLNDTTSIATTSNKIKSQLAYESFGTPSIATRYAMGPADAEAALAGLPDRVVVKPFDGEGGRGVKFFDDHASARRYIERHFAGSPNAPVLLVQERIPGAMVRWQTPAGEATESGMDYRALITRDRADRPFVHTLMQRIGAPGSGTSNLDGGGWGRNVAVEEAPPALVETALAGYAPIPGRFDMAGVDVMPVGRHIDQAIEDHAARQFVVTETNSAPGIPDLRLGRDFAGAVADRAIDLASR